VGQFTSVNAGNIPVSATVAFNDPDGDGNNVGLLLGYRDLLTIPTAVVSGTAGTPIYVVGTDYTVDYTNGMITRSAGSSIPASGSVQVAVTMVANAAEVYAFGGFSRVNYMPGQFIHTRPDGKRIICDLFRMSTNGRLLLEFRETEFNMYDVQWNLIADLSRAQGAMYFQIRRETP